MRLNTIPDSLFWYFLKDIMARKKFELIASAFDKKGRIICSSTNDYEKSSPWMKRFSLLAGESEHRIFLHAEVACLLKASENSVYSLLVQRFAANGSPALAKPCKACEAAIRFFGVKEVRYTTPSGIVLMEI